MKTSAVSLLLPVLGFLVLGCGTAKKPDVVGEEVTYTADSVTMKGYLAYDSRTSGKRPGVLVVHEWWGHNDYARKRARMLAELGYVALAVDMYGDGRQAAHPDDAGKFATEVMKNMESAKARFLAAKDVLQRNPVCDPDNVAAIGYCFGGGVVLHMARLGVDVKGVASFHGSLGTNAPAERGQVKAQILVCNGADDPFLTPETVEAFKKEMQDAGVTYTFINYPGAKHSFTNPDADKFGKEFRLPLQYNKAADEASWSELQKFLKQIFAR